MKVYRISCKGFFGASYYKTREEAQIAADRRNAIGSQTWVVREIIIP